MRISEADIATIHALLKDYQCYVDNYHTLSDAYAFPLFKTPRDILPRREVRERIANTAPSITKVLSMELPQGFSLLKCIDEQCYAWNAHSTLGLHGPVTEFQARLWCWQNEYVNEEVEITLVEDEDGEEVIGVVADEVEENRDCNGVRWSSNNGNGAALERSMIERMFNQEMHGS